MRKYCAHLAVLAILVFSFSVPTHAQGATSKIDVFGGFSFLANNYYSTSQQAQWNTLTGGTYVINGYHFQGTYNLTKHFGIMADFSNHSGTTDETSSYNYADCCGYTSSSQYTLHLDQKMRTFAFGPSFSVEEKKLRLSAHTLVGVSTAQMTALTTSNSSDSNLNTSSSNYNSTWPSNTGMAVVVGGSADFMFAKHLGWRIAQIDYVHSVLQGCPNWTNTWTYNGSPSGTNSGTPNTGCDAGVNNLRISTGIVFRLGGK